MFALFKNCGGSLDAMVVAHTKVCRNAMSSRNHRSKWMTLPELEQAYGEVSAKDMFNHLQGTGQWRPHPSVPSNFHHPLHFRLCENQMFAQAPNVRSVDQVWVCLDDEARTADEENRMTELALEVDADVAADLLDTGSCCLQSCN